MRKPLQRLLQILVVTLVFVSTQTHADTHQIIEESDINTTSKDHPTNETLADQAPNENTTNEAEVSEVETTPVDDEILSSEELEVETTPNEEEDSVVEEIETIEEQASNETISSYALNANEVIVTSFSELKNFIVNRGNGIYDTFYLGADLNGLISGIRVPSGYSFIIDGTNPETQERHTFNEYRSAATADTISHAGTSPVSMTLRNINIEGQNFYGTIYTSGANENVKVIYDNVNYTGPQITHNIGGTAIYRNSTIKIGEKSYYSASQEVGEVKHVIFEGTVTLDQANGLGPVFTMTSSNSFTFTQGAQVDISSRRGINNRTTATKILFEENAVLNFTQLAAPGTSAAFYLEGAQGSFIMRPGSAFNVDRPFTTNTGESILYSAKLGTAIIDGGTITHKHGGTHTSYGLFNLANMTLSNNAKIDIEIGKNLSFTPFDVTKFSDLIDSSITIKLGGNYDATAPIIGATSAVQSNPYKIINSKLHLEANIISMYAVNVGTLTLEGSDLKFVGHTEMKFNPVRHTALSGMKDTTYELNFGNFTPTGAMIWRSQVADFTLDNSHIKVKGSHIKNAILESRHLSLIGTSTIDLESTGNIAASVIATNTVSEIKNLNFFVKASGNYSPSLPMFNIKTLGSLSIDNSIFTIDVNNWTSPLFSLNTDATIANSEIKTTSNGILSNGIINSNGAVNVITSKMNFTTNQLNNPYITGASLHIQDSEINSALSKTEMLSGKALFMVKEFSASKNSALSLTNQIASVSIINPLSETFTLDQSTVIYQSNSQTVPVIKTKTLTSTQSTLDITVDEAQMETQALLVVDTLQSIDASLLLNAKSGTIDAGVLVSKEFTFSQASNTTKDRLLIIAPTANTILRTEEMTVSVAINASQTNIWSTFNTGGLANKPNLRYECDDLAHGNLEFGYYHPIGKPESIKFSSNDFNSLLWDNPEETLSFKTSVMKILSIGSFSLDVNDFSAGDTKVQGNTEANAEIEIRYQNNNTPHTAIGNADESGTFTINTLALAKSDIQVEASINYLYRTTPASPITSGSLRFGEKDNTITFGNLKVPNKATIFNRTNEMNIEIIDDRTTGSAWKLEVKLVGHLSDVNDVRPELVDALIYKKGEQKTVLKPNIPVEIANSQTHSQEVTQLHWAEDEGILLSIQDPWSVYSNTEYSAKIQWILSDLK